MADHGRPIEFGFFLIPMADEAKQLVETAVLLDELGYDFVAIQDHPYQRRFLDTWTLISVLAARTERIRFFPDVVSLPLRPPAVLAKSVASLDILTGGRIELALGAGAFWEAIGAMGGPIRTPGQAVAATSEAIDVIRAMWSDERTPIVKGEHYWLSGVHPGPQPAHDVGIWIGASGPRMLRLIGTKADGWVISLGRSGPDELTSLNQVIDDAAREAGRDPAAIRRVLNIGGAFVPAERGPVGSLDQGIVGPPDRWVDALSKLAVEQGFDTFVLATPADPEFFRVFASDVAPAVRERVNALRAR